MICMLSPPPPTYDGRNGIGRPLFISVGKTGLRSPKKTHNRHSMNRLDLVMGKLVRLSETPKNNETTDTQEQRLSLNVLPRGSPPICIRGEPWEKPKTQSVYPKRHPTPRKSKKSFYLGLCHSSSVGHAFLYERK